MMKVNKIIGSFCHNPESFCNQKAERIFDQTFSRLKKIKIVHFKDMYSVTQ